MWCVAALKNATGSRFIVYVPDMDANKVLSGEIPFETLLGGLEQLDIMLEAKGSALVHCL